MSGFKGIMKNGWHPEKSGGIKNSVSGLMGRNKDSASDSSNHVARPLSDLKDPSSFAPPPKRTSSGLAPAPPPVSAKRKVITSPSKYMDPRADTIEPSPRDMGALAIEAPPEARDEGPQLPKPYRVNSAQNLPKPSAQRDGAGGRSPPPYSEATGTAPTPKALPPSLPPRLPPRGPAGSSAGFDQGYNMLNGGAVNRLGAAGVSVPAFGIGRGVVANTSSPSPPPAVQPSTASGPGTGKWGSQVNELQGRFANMKPPSTATSAQEPPTQGTTWAQKQAALKTASNFHKDPSSVSLSDAKAAASTVNNFRQRHGEQVASGAKTVNNLNQRYGVMDKVGALADAQPSSTPSQSSPSSLPGPGRTYTAAVAGKKKPPPPPPKRKPGLAAAAQEEDAPPPIPMSTRPAF